MKNPLIPIDDSPATLRALAFALNAMFGRSDVQVHVLNVQAPKLHPWPGKLISPDMINAELRNDGAKLLEPAQAMALAAGMACVPQVSIGAAGEEIAACAAKHGCDVIVMGTRGTGAVARLMMGSVAQKVVHLSPVPVTLVK